MTDISPAAQAAREQARDPHGRFGAQPASETSLALEDTASVPLSGLGLDDGGSMTVGEHEHGESRFGDLTITRYEDSYRPACAPSTDLAPAVPDYVEADDVPAYLQARAGFVAHRLGARYDGEAEVDGTEVTFRLVGEAMDGQAGTEDVLDHLEATTAAVRLDDDVDSGTLHDELRADLARFDDAVDRETDKVLDMVRWHAEADAEYGEPWGPGEPSRWRFSETTRAAVADELVRVRSEQAGAVEEYEAQVAGRPGGGTMFARAFSDRLVGVERGAMPTGFEVGGTDAGPALDSEVEYLGSTVRHNADGTVDLT